MGSSITLVVDEFNWINGPADDAEDQCAHGYVKFQINGTTFVNPENGMLTVSAAALFLLRTLTDDHTQKNPVSEYNRLFPHCGFTVWPSGERYKVLCMGCAHGIDLDVVHMDKSVRVSDRNTKSETVSRSDWIKAVLGFARQISEYYGRSEKKAAIADEYDREGWKLFWEEWQTRIDTAKDIRL